MIRRGLAVVVLALFVAGPAAAVTQRTTLPDVEDGVMCPSCREPLALAQSPQALAERDYIRGLIAQGLSEPQIDQALVGQYGPAVLAKPPAHGFNLTVYILPPALLVAGIVTLLVALPRWRRRARTADPAPGDHLSAADAARLEADLARFDG